MISEAMGGLLNVFIYISELYLLLSVDREGITRALNNFNLNQVIMTKQFVSYLFLTQSSGADG